MNEYTISCGNIFKDLGIKNAEQKFAKVQLASIIYDLMEVKKLSHEEAANLLGIELSQVFNLKNGHLKEFSLEQLLSFLVILGQKIDILITSNLETVNESSINVRYASLNQ